ncbi:MAG TPA: type I-U CRISPR-associated protein Csb2 [Streptosporangiaceae bacterium]|nr:type I-U CRISPR-associated protein Csb2 [Streptosporangiaceae bacterium]
MGTAIAIRFPLGRYHATPWDRSVNEGAAEWPPSPWRLLRALIATWYTRWPDLPAPVLDRLLEALDGPPSYRTPPARPAHTRHYLPDLSHKKGETGGTDLTLDPFLSVARDDDLFVRWDADLDSEQRGVLAKLAELLPYLGRAESVCEARLLDSDPVPDEAWWRPGAGGARKARLLAPARPVSRAALEMSTVDMRRNRRTVPAGSIWVSYAAGEPATEQAVGRRVPPVEAVRFAVVPRVPMKSGNGILLADRVHEIVARKLANAGTEGSEGSPGSAGGAGCPGTEILGSGGAATDHHHAHWVPIAGGWERGASVESLVVWVPYGLSAEDVAALVTLREVSGQRRGRGDDEGYEVRGFPPVELLFQAAGSIEQVAPELRGPARRWRSLTPYLPVRHRKRETLDEFLAADVATELGYRDRPSAAVARLELAGGVPDRWAREFRRYRLNERMGRSRPGLGLRLEFAEEVDGPLLLGQLSHFGYGIFIPDPV